MVTCPVQVLSHDIDFSIHEIRPCLNVTMQVCLPNQGLESSQNPTHNHPEISTLDLSPPRQNRKTHVYLWFVTETKLQNYAKLEPFAMRINADDNWILRKFLNES